jgi:hypothetical protein
MMHTIVKGRINCGNRKLILKHLLIYVSNWNPQKSGKNFQLQNKKLIQFRQKKRFLDPKRS